MLFVSHALSFCAVTGYKFICEKLRVNEERVTIRVLFKLLNEDNNKWKEKKLHRENSRVEATEATAKKSFK